MLKRVFNNTLFYGLLMADCADWGVPAFGICMKDEIWLFLCKIG
ncbi:hypothetical protein [Moraxella lacunata]|nr:hypothetical protein [Moraxella lacunata]